MVPDLAKRVRLALEILPEPRREEYLSTLRSEFPDQAAEVFKVRDCFQRNQSADRCLRVVLRGDSSPSDISSESFKAAQAIVTAGEQTLAKEGNAGLVRFAHAVDDTFLEKEYHTLPIDERRALENLTHFYFRHFRLPFPFLPSFLPAVMDPNAQARFQRYHTRTITPATTNPPLCPNADQFERHDVEIAGLAYKIPIFRPVDSVYPWPFIESDLLIGFEFIKSFLTPEDFEALLVPKNGGPHISFYLVDPISSREIMKHPANTILLGCDIRTDDRGGEFNFETNRIMILPAQGSDLIRPYARVAHLPLNINIVTTTPWTLEESVASTTSATWQILFHELGHAIYYHLGLRFNDIFVGTNRLYNWTDQLIKSSPSDESLRSFIPNYTWSSQNVGDTFAFSMEGRKYALKNQPEFFAEMVAEYLYNQMQPWIPYTPADQARSILMRQFFGADGLNPGAFAPSNIEATFRAKGIPMTFTPPPPPAPSKLPIAPIISPAVHSSTTATKFEVRIAGTITGFGRPGFRLSGSAKPSHETYSLRGGGLVGLQGSSGDSSDTQILFGMEVSLEIIPHWLLGLEVFAMVGGIVGDADDNRSFRAFLEPGTRFSFHPWRRDGRGIHLWLGGGYLVSNPEFTTPQVEVGLGFNFLPF